MKKKDIPNILTVSRLFTALLVLLFICVGVVKSGSKSWWFGFAGFFLLVSGITDWLDGYLARKWNCISNFGKTFDPVADKFVLLFPILILSCIGDIHWFLGFILVARDVIMDIIRICMWRKKVYVSAIKLAKWKTVAQFIGVFFILLQASRIGNFVLFAAAILSVLSFFIYVKKLTKKW